MIQTKNVFYVHHARDNTKSKIQQQFKVLWCQGRELYCVEHTFASPKAVKERIHFLTGRPVTCLGTEDEWVAKTNKPKGER